MSDQPTIGIAINLQNNTKESIPTLKHTSPAQPATQVHTPFHIAIMGDFSGRENQGHNKKNKKSRLIEIDRDNYESVMARFDIQLNLHFSADNAIQINLKELDDFHPDMLYENLDSFDKLKSLRRRLKNPKTFANAAAEIQGWMTEQPQAAPNTSSNENIHTPNNVPDNLLDRILNTQKDVALKSSSSQATQIDNLIRSIVAPYVEPKADPRLNEMLTIVDTAIESHMRGILHHPDFQAIESTWQSIYFLIKRIETHSQLKLFLLDVSKDELHTEFTTKNMALSNTYKLFSDTSIGDIPWSILMGNYIFSDSTDDIALLANMGHMAEQIGAPFISAANETLAGCTSFEHTPDYSDWNYITNNETKTAWETLRQSTVAPYIALALPRFLLRLPYGQKSNPVETFKFEEITDKNIHSDYLWGNAAFIKLECLARHFKEHGWQMKLGQITQTDNLPIHYFTEDGATISKPIAEIMLTDRAGEILKNHGLTPIWSVRNKDYILSMDYLSISEPRKNIDGRWN